MLFPEITIVKVKTTERLEGAGFVVLLNTPRNLNLNPKTENNKI